MKDKKSMFKSPLAKFTMLGTAAVMASAITLNGFPANASDAPKEKGTEKKSNKTVSKKKEETKTNVVYIVLDDSGFSDLGSYGSEIKTPNLDWLAE